MEGVVPGTRRDRRDGGGRRLLLLEGGEALREPSRELARARLVHDRAVVPGDLVDLEPAARHAAPTEARVGDDARRLPAGAEERDLSVVRPGNVGLERRAP